MKLLLTSMMILISFCLLHAQHFETEMSPNGITFPSMSSWQRSNLDPPVVGQCFFNKDTKGLECYSGNGISGQWVSFQSSTEESDDKRNTHYGYGTDFELGFGNTKIGWDAEGPQDGNYNTLIGIKSGEDMNRGNNNTFLGAHVGKESQGDYNVFIGSGTGGGLATDHTLIIESSYGLSEPLIYGDFQDDYLNINGAVNISQVLKLQALTTAPTCNTDALGSLYMDAATETLKLCTSMGWRGLSMEP